jgi:hypothetical protein
MEMAGKQFSPFMEMVVQPCLTEWATSVLQNGQLRLTVYENG